MTKYAKAGDRFTDLTTLEMLVAVPLSVSQSKDVPAEKVAVLVEALRFYSNPKNWVTAEWGDDQFTPHAIPMVQQEDGMLFCDCGDRARVALAEYERETDHA